MKRVDLRTRRVLTALFTVALVAVALQRPARTAGSTIHVTTTAQGIADDNLCSLQEAIYSANRDIALAPTSFNPIGGWFDTLCEPGSGDDVIELQAGATYNMTSILDDPYNPLGPTATPIVYSNITIEGHGAKLVRSNPNRDFAGLPNFRAFAVSRASFGDPDNDVSLHGSTGSLYIKNLEIIGFTAKGGTGKGGAGGGLGAGGAIYVYDATLTVENSTFQDNGAGGGNGTVVTNNTAGGGGGGLGGDGGDTIAGLGLIGGGGGGGSRGHGGKSGYYTLGGGGGGGGGTLTPGDDGMDEREVSPTHGAGGWRCGGDGGRTDIGLGSDNGDNASCNGGGGGGGESYRPGVGIILNGNGGRGAYGGGGGGGGHDLGNGGDGGFGGGGGAGSAYQTRLDGFGPDGGDGGFGAGGGAGWGGYVSGGPGVGGTFGGDADQTHGGGGAGLGGAIFSHRGTVYVFNSTFYGNFAVRGVGGGGSAHNGTDAGGAIFSVDGSVIIVHATIANNESTGSGAGVVYYHSTETDSGSLAIHNTIIAKNVPAVSECRVTGHDLGEITVSGTGNLFTTNAGCAGQVASADPGLGPLQLNAPGNTRTMALFENSPALNVADDDPSIVLPTDQRGVARPAGGGYDIGAFELLPNFTFSPIDEITMSVGGFAATDVTLNSLDGLSGLIALDAPAASSGYTVFFTVNPVNLPQNGSATSTLTVQLGPTITPGTHTFEIGGTIGSLSHSATVTVNVVATLTSVADLVGTLGSTGCIDNLGVANAFIAKLTVAQNLSNAGRSLPAANALAALLYQIDAQTGKHLRTSCEVGGQTIDPSAALKTDVQAVMQSITTAAPNPLMGNVVTTAGLGVGNATVTLSGASITAASAITDVTGFYYFPVTSGLKAGAGFQVSVPLSTKKKGVASQQFIWSGAATVLNNLVFE